MEALRQVQRNPKGAVPYGHMQSIRCNAVCTASNCQQAAAVPIVRVLKQSIPAAALFCVLIMARCCSAGRKRIMARRSSQEHEEFL